MSVTWPKGRAAAAAFTFDFDAESVWIADDPDNAHRPGVLSQGRYGAKVAVPLILELLDRHRLHATFFVPGTVAESYPERVQQIVDAGHELGSHGYTHTGPAKMSGPDEEERELLRAKEILERFAPVSGYRSPSWDFSDTTLDLIARHGYRYSSNFMDDLHPYVHAPSGIVELPVQWLLDDAAHFWFSPEDWMRKIASPAEVEAMWLAEFEGIRALGGVFVLTMHPQVIGRPSRLRMLERVIDHVTGCDDVWVAPLAEIAAAVEG